MRPQHGLSAWEKDDGAESVASANAGSIANCQQVLLRLISGREVVVDLSTVRLDDFQQVFTSEDNASFEAVLDRDRERRRQKEWWVETSEEKHNTKCKAQALEFEVDAPTSTGQIMTCEFQAEGAVFWCLDSWWCCCLLFPPENPWTWTWTWSGL